MRKQLSSPPVKVFSSLISPPPSFKIRKKERKKRKEKIKEERIK
jgi:hypothetical protein